MEPAGPDRDERLDDVKSLAERVRVRVEKGEDTIAAKLDPEQQEVKRHDRCKRGVPQVLEVHAGQVKQQGGDGGAHHRRAQVRLLDDEQNKQERGHRGGQNGAAKILNAVHAALEPPGQEQDQHGFGKLGGLKLHGPELDPAVGAVRVMPEECADQQEDRDRDRREDHRRIVEAPVVDVHKHPHGG